MSYTSFSFGGLALLGSASPGAAEGSGDGLAILPGESVTAVFSVTNTGKRPGTAVPQLYLRDMVSSTVSR